eukprot:5590038-Amphidinium_carterae.1
MAPLFVVTHYHDYVTWTHAMTVTSTLIVESLGVCMVNLAGMHSHGYVTLDCHTSVVSAPRWIPGLPSQLRSQRLTLEGNSHKNLSARVFGMAHLAALADCTLHPHPKALPTLDNCSNFTMKQNHFESFTQLQRHMVPTQ